MDLRRAILILSTLLLCILSISAHAVSPDSVKWVGEKENPALWVTIRADFHDELQPDDPVKVAPVLAYSYKYIYRVALYQDAAVVIVGHLETKDSKYGGYYSAFNYDLGSRALRSIKGAEGLSVFKFSRFLSVDSAEPADIFFTWLTCTECEESQILSAFHYQADKGEWTLRDWDAKKDMWWTTAAGPVIATDVSASDTISFDCLYGFLTSGKLAFAIRCREIAEPETGKRTVTDITAEYSFKGDESKLEIEGGEKREKVLSELCELSPKNKLCRRTVAPAAKQ